MDVAVVFFVISVVVTGLVKGLSSVVFVVVFFILSLLSAQKETLHLCKAPFICSSSFL